jgi:hypothetical protein
MQVQRSYLPNAEAMLAALRIVLCLPRQTCPVFDNDLLSDCSWSDSYMPDRAGTGENADSGQEGKE